MSEHCSGKHGRPSRLAAALAAAMALAAPGLAQQPSHHHGQMGPGPRGGSPPGWGRPASAGPRGGPPAGWGGPAAAGPRELGPYDPRQHNGYWLGQRWHYGPPPAPVIRDPGFRPGFAPFRPGAFLPPQYEGEAIGDYAQFHLRRPPYGYRWVRAGADFLLVSTGTGQIFDVVPGY